MSTARRTCISASGIIRWRRSSPLEVEFIVDASFDGDLVVPETLISRLDVSISELRGLQLAGGIEQHRLSYEMLLEWDGEPRLVKVLTLDGNPLLGNNLWMDAMLQAENANGGEVLFEPLQTNFSINKEQFTSWYKAMGARR